MRKVTKKGLWWTAAAAALATGLAGISSPALAQTQAPADDEEETAQQEEGNDIVVTGSRIRRNEFTSSAPVQIITSEESTLEGLIDTSEILQGSTIAAGSAQINNQFTGFVVEGGPGVNTLSLRGLGPTRTLVLLNGRRLNPAGTRGQVGAVDLNVIPAAILARTEILKDGASSIYGSDAIAGVVNLITRDDLDGGLLAGSALLTFDGGAEQFNVNGAYGQTFDRGQYSISFDYFRGEPLTFADRDYLSCSQDLVRATPAPAFGGSGSFLDIIDPRTGQSKCYNQLGGVVDRLGTGGTTTAGFLNNIGRFVPNANSVAGGGQFGLDIAGFQRVGLSFAQVSNRLHGTALTASNTALAATLTPAQFAAVEAAWRTSQAAVPNDLPVSLRRTIVSPVERSTLFFQGSFDLGAGLEIYGEALWNRRESEQLTTRQIFPNVSAGNPNNPFPVTSRAIPIVPFDQSQVVDTYRTVVGLSGDLPFLTSWTFDIFAQYGRAEGEYTTQSWYNDRVLATTGVAACTTTGITNISNYNCADVPTGVSWFSTGWVNNGVLPANQRNFLEYEETGTTIYTQTLVQGIVTGDVIQLPAGMLSAAVGFEWREEEIDDTPGFQARNNNQWGLTSAGRTAGSDAVREVFAEVEVPLLRGLPGIESLTFNGSARRTDYDSYGENSTHRLGVNWQVTPSFRIRATQGTSYRAPALYELYLANQTAFGNQNIDPCWLYETSSNPLIAANCAAAGVPLNFTGGGSASPLIVTGGGAGVLEAETSDASTLGIVWTPSFADLNIAVDYWEFEINGQVAQFGSAAILGACYGQADYPNNPFCTLFQRNGATQSGGIAPYGIISVNNSYVNLDNQVARGLDLTVRYEHEFSFGTFILNSDTTWTFEEVVTFFANRSAPNSSNGEIYSPDAVGNVSFRFDRGDWTYFWDMDWQAKQSDTEPFLGDVFGWRGSPIQGYYKQYAEFTATHDMSVRYQSDNWQVNAGIQNVFDESPPSVSTGSVAFGGRLGNIAGFAGNRSLLAGRTGFVSVSRRF